MRVKNAGLILMLFLGGCATQGIKPQEAIALHDQADAFYAQGDCANARSAYEQLVKHFPREASFHFRIGNCHALELDYEEAVAAYERALQLDPKSSRAWYNLSYVRAQMLAETVIRMHEQLDPTDPDVQQMRRLVADVLAPFDHQLLLPDDGVALEDRMEADLSNTEEDTAPPLDGMMEEGLDELRAEQGESPAEQPVINP